MEKSMSLNIPSKVRSTIYVISVLGTAIILPLHEASVVSDLVLKVWMSLTGAASGLAAFNVTPDKE